MRATKNALMAGRDVVPNVPDLFGSIGLGQIRQTWRTDRESKAGLYFVGASRGKEMGR